MIGLAYGFGLESVWIHEQLRIEGVKPLLIVCKGYLDRLPKPINVLLKGEDYLVLRREFEEKWDVYEDFNPHRFSCKNYTNTIIEWAKQQPTRPFNMLYLGRRLEDMKLKLEPLQDVEFSPPDNAFGFKLEFPLWDWRRVENCLLPPALEAELLEGI